MGERDEGRGRKQEKERDTERKEGKDMTEMSEK